MTSLVRKLGLLMWMISAVGNCAACRWVSLVWPQQNILWLGRHTVFKLWLQIVSA